MLEDLEELEPMLPPEDGGDKIPVWIVGLGVTILFFIAVGVAWGIFSGRF